MYKIRSYIFRTNKYLLVACRDASASSSKYGLTSSIFNFITFPGSLMGIVSMSCSVSVSVSNKILPIKAHLLDWSNKTQCHYISIVNTIQHQSIYTSHVIYIVHIVHI